jgi:molecular chaperone DnaK
LGKLKEAVLSKNMADIEAHTATLNTAWQAASEDLYKATQGDANAGDASGAGDANAGGSSGKADEVQDVDFEEVK